MHEKGLGACDELHECWVKTLSEMGFNIHIFPNVFLCISVDLYLDISKGNEVVRSSR
jgi:hypothetical protein